jgi:serine/threonine-protein kinase
LNELLRGKYRIVREIARSNDVVYEATDVSLGRRVAIKELNMPAGLTGSPRHERIERFTREARAAGRLNHPNIVSIFDFGEENGRYFIAMEYLEGQTLRDVLHVRKPLPLAEAIDIACQVLDALGFAHANGVVHRDIKPENIQILPGGKVKLTDFGIARLSEEPALTSNGQVFGTPSYMSPEQIEGRSIDSRSDLFSLGVVLYEMLSGRKPFVGDSVVSITYAIMHAEPPPIPGIPMGVEQVYRRALAKQPAQRHSSAEQMRMDLRAAERTPPAFLTGQLSTGASGYLPSGQTYGGAPAGYPPGMTGSLPGSYTGTLPGGYVGGMPAGYAGGVPSSMPVLPSQSPGSTGNPSLPWAWSGTLAPGQVPTTNPSGVLVPPGLTGQLPPGYAVPPLPAGVYAQPGMFPPRRQVTLPTMSPGMRNFLIAVFVAVVIGGAIGFGIIAFLNSYDQYKTVAGARTIGLLMQDGAAAYGRRDYTTAVERFQKAESLGLQGADRPTVEHNLVASYIQLARVDSADGKTDDAIALYNKALKLAPNDSVAHSDLAALLDRLGRKQDAAHERSEAQAGTFAGTDPNASLKINSAPQAGTSAGSAPETNDQFTADRRGQAQALIKQGDDLYTSGDKDGAREKWQSAIETAPATPERDLAQQRLDQTAPQPTFTGQE